MELVVFPTVFLYSLIVCCLQEAVFEPDEDDVVDSSVSDLIIHISSQRVLCSSITLKW